MYKLAGVGVAILFVSSMRVLMLTVHGRVALFQSAWPNTAGTGCTINLDSVN